MDVIVLEVDSENRRLSLGHKQLEENPWEVFETVFVEGSEHEGTITVINEKGGVVTLPYGVEGFCPKRHLTKEDGSAGKVEETMKFQVIEFARESRKIIVSHTHTHNEEVAKEKGGTDKNETRTTARKGTAKAVKKMNDNLEKTTLGDLDALSSLKASMEESEKDKKKKK